eukprot:m.153162 g.153162  ORF g.153162 m.153162 type:complete len:66 (-) comp14282_c0_seq2:1562-1759(-)
MINRDRDGSTCAHTRALATPAQQHTRPHTHAAKQPLMHLLSLGGLCVRGFGEETSRRMDHGAPQD